MILSLQEIKNTALALLEVGFIPVPVIFGESPRKISKKLGYFLNGQPEYIRLNYKDITKKVVTDNLDLWFSNCVGIGVLSQGNRSDRGTYLNRIDVDRLNFESENDFNLVVAELTAKFKNLPTWGFTTISNGFAILFESAFDFGNKKINYQGIYIGDASYHNVIPPSQGYKLCWQNDLLEITKTQLTSLGLDFEDCIELEEAKDQHTDFLAYVGVLEQFKIAFQYDFTEPKPLGYDDSYTSWIELLLVGRYLDQKYNVEQFKEVFIEFSQFVGELSEKWDYNTLSVIEREWAKEDSGELGLGTLISWAKHIWSGSDWKKKVKPVDKEKVTSWLTVNSLNTDYLDPENTIEQKAKLEATLRYNEIKALEKINNYRLMADNGYESFIKSNDLIKSDIDLSDFVPGIMSDLLKEWVRYIGWRSDAILLNLLGGLSGVWKNPTILTLPGVDFKIHPNLFICSAAPTGIKKTPVLNMVVVNGLGHLQDNLMLAHENALEEWKLGDRSTRGDEPRKPLIFSTGGSTIEGVMQGFLAKPECTQVEIWDEMAPLLGMESYSNQREATKRFYLKAYDGGRVQYHRAKNDGVVYLKNSQLALIGFIQIDKLKNYFKAESIIDGFLPRFLFVTQETFVISLDDDLEELQNTFSRHIERLYWYAEKLATRDLRLSSGAKKKFKEFKNFIEDQQLNSLDETLIEFLGKAVGQVGKIAMNLHLLNSSADLWASAGALESPVENYLLDELISSSTMEKAIFLYWQYNSHLEKLKITYSDDQEFIEYVNKIKKALLKYPGKTTGELRQIYRGVRSKVKLDFLNSVIGTLIERGSIVTETKGKRVGLYWKEPARTKQE